MVTKYPGDLVTPDWFPFVIESKCRRVDDPAVDFYRLPEQGEAHGLLLWFKDLESRARSMNARPLLILKRDYGVELAVLPTATLWELRAIDLRYSKAKMNPYELVHVGELSILPLAVLAPLLAQDILHELGRPGKPSLPQAGSASTISNSLPGTPAEDTKLLNHSTPAIVGTT
jgi:hypothetical protein